MNGESFEFNLDEGVSEDYEQAWEAAVGQGADLHALWDTKYGSHKMLPKGVIEAFM